ncbi:MAG: hypothetical protein K5796_07780, partial [Lachnospiraceae bacterium]|nr:hypothetical protein [Lachnospiraceae bacterium]
MKVKKRKNWLLDKMATFVVVASMVASIAMVMLPNSVIKADTYVTPPAFTAEAGSTFTLDVKPGQITRVRTLVGDYDASMAEGQYSFVSFGIDSSDSRIVASDLKLSYQTGQFYPAANEIIGDNFPQYNIDPTGKMTIDFRMNCSEDIPEGEYNLTFYAMALRDATGALITWGLRSDKNITTVKIPLITYTIKNSYPSKAAVISIEKISLSKDTLNQGESNSLVIRVKNKGQADTSELVINPGLDLKDFLPDYDLKTIKIGSIKVGEIKTATVPFIVGKDTANGIHEIKVSVTGKDVFNNELATEESIYVTVGTKDVKPSNAPYLTLSTKQNYRKLKPSTDDSVIVRITNTGDKKATKVRLSCDSGFGVESGLTKNYTDSYIKVDDIEAGETVKVEVPFMVGASFAKGVHELTFSASFADEEKNAYVSEKMTMYVEHYKTGEVAEEDGHTYLQISGVSQSPASPMAGQRVTVSFNVKNKGTEKIKDLHFYGTGLAATGFQPVSGEPYQNEGSLDAGESKKVTMTFMAGEDIPNGVNALAIGYDYFDSKYEQKAATTTIFVLNVINHKFDEIDVGRPKIIVSDYVTEPDILRAGETFDFSYTLKNTHTGKEARNIKITLSQADGVIAPAEGTNIFYIDKLDPTQEAVLSLPLKSRADTVTGDYAVVLKLEYEYDDMSDVDKEHGGVSEENTLKIRVIENYRPV